MIFLYTVTTTFSSSCIPITLLNRNITQSPLIFCWCLMIITFISKCSQKFQNKFKILLRFCVFSFCQSPGTWGFIHLLTFLQDGWLEWESHRCECSQACGYNLGQETPIHEEGLRIWYYAAMGFNSLLSSFCSTLIRWEIMILD